MLICPSCGARNDAEALVCQSCSAPLSDEAGAPLAKTAGGDPALPPLPDGGLAASMPDWLRTPTATQGETADTRAGSATQPSAPINDEVLDLRTLISEDDLPEWVQRLASDSPGTIVPGQRSSAAAAAPVTDNATTMPSRTLQAGGESLNPAAPASKCGSRQPSNADISDHPAGTSEVMTLERRRSRWIMLVAVVALLIVVAILFSWRAGLF